MASPKAFLLFEDTGTSPSGKTFTYKVRAAASGAHLADIRFHAPWRKYCSGKDELEYRAKQRSFHQMYGHGARNYVWARMKTSKTGRVLRASKDYEAFERTWNQERLGIPLSNREIRAVSERASRQRPTPVVENTEPKLLESGA